MNILSVTIIEDDVELNDLWGEYINSQRDFILASSYTNCETALLHIHQDKPDIILMDINLNGQMTGIEGVREIKKILPRTDIIMVTVNEDDDSVFQSLRAGASGYLVKNILLDDLLAAIRKIRTEGAAMKMNIACKVIKYFQQEKVMQELTDREHQVLKELCNGKSQKQIADALNIQPDTVKFHIKNIYKKLNVVNAAQAGHVAGKMGLV